MADTTALPDDILDAWEGAYTGLSSEEAAAIRYANTDSPWGGFGGGWVVDQGLEAERSGREADRAIEEASEDVQDAVTGAVERTQLFIQDTAAGAADAATPDWFGWFKWIALLAILLYLAKPGLEIGANLTEAS